MSEKDSTWNGPSGASTDDLQQELHFVGHSTPRVDIRRKVTGAARYTDDLTRPGMLHGAILPSPHAHARILSYDVSAAEAVAGVVAVVTGDDFPEGYMGPFIKDECAIAKDKVRYIGEPVAAVAAINRETARRAARLIKVEYEVLPAVLDLDAAMLPDSPLVHEDLDSYLKIYAAKFHGNVASESCYEEGDVDSAWDECDAIVEGVYETRAQNHLSMEPCSALAEVMPDGRVELWSTNQSVFRVQSNISEALKMPMSKIHCRTVDIGAGFGNKMELHIQGIVVVLAMKARRPVKITLTREEDFEMVRARHPTRIRCRTGAKADGTLVAHEVDILMECGAFADDSPGVLGYGLLCSRGPYRIPNVRTQGKLVYTNRLRFAAFRGFGNPQVTMANEAQIDRLAEQLGMDPIDLKMKNVVEKGDHSYLGQPIISCGLKECLDKVRQASDWDRRCAESGREVVPGKRRGIGMAVAGHISGLLATAAIVRVLEDGTIILCTGVVDIGQGSETILTQICAETLKVPMEQVVSPPPDTDGSPYNWGTTGSRSTYMTGKAVQEAAQRAADQLKGHAAEMLECNIDELELRFGGRVGVKGDAERQVSFLEISLRAHWGVGGPIIGTHSFIFDQDTVDPKRAVVSGLPFGRIGAWVYTAQVVELDVDVGTGQVDIVNSWVAIDLGKAVNPQLVEGQMEGSFVQGQGYALFEEMVWDEARLINPTMMDYKAPGSMDVPYNIETIIVEHPDYTGPYGAKSCGEIGIVAVAPAISHAIYKATGARLPDLPMKPERVLDALEGLSG